MLSGEREIRAQLVTIGTDCDRINPSDEKEAPDKARFGMPMGKVDRGINHLGTSIFPDLTKGSLSLLRPLFRRSYLETEISVMVFGRFPSNMLPTLP